MTMPPNLDPNTTAMLLHPVTRQKPIAIAAFYPDGQMETFAPDAIVQDERTLPHPAQDGLCLDYVASIQQVTVMFSQDSAVSPTQTLASTWYGSGNNYRCRTYTLK